MDKKNKNKITSVFNTHFGSPECMIFAPGRANIIGEHTDYNNGLVLPFAIGQGVHLFASKNDTPFIHIIAIDTNESSTIDLQDKDKSPKYGWEKYFIQVLNSINDFEYSGINMVFGGDLPIGAGVSSSSSITCGFIAVLNELFQWNMETKTMVSKAVEAEVGYGVRGGIMDQFTIFNGLKNKAILLDCNDNSSEFIDLDLKEHSFYLINSNVKHNLIHTDYNVRREECELAVSIISKSHRNIRSLRELEVNELPVIKSLLDKTLFNRVNFVLHENMRVVDAKKALLKNNMDILGKLLYQSHEGLSLEYEVSCQELDWLVKYTIDKESVLGARMMGGGFGGCTINLVKGLLDEKWKNEISESYHKQFAIYPDILLIEAVDGINS